VSRPTCYAFLVEPDETAFHPLLDYASVTITQGQYGAMSASVTARADASPVSTVLAEAAGAEGYQWQLWVWHDSAILFRGPLVKFRAAHAGSDGSAYVGLESENHVAHALRRRVCWTSTKADVAEALAAPNQILLNLIDDAMGGVAGPITPTSYPGGTARTDFKNLTYSAGVVSGAPALVTYDIQNGSNLHDVAEDLCQLYDMVVTQNRNADATYSFDVQYPLEINDYSDTIWLTIRHGSAAAFSIDQPYTLVTVGRAAGAGAGATQTDTFTSSNVATYGVYEDQVSLPNGTSNAVAERATQIMRAATPQTAYEVVAVATGQAEFIADYKWRDKIRIYDPIWGKEADKTVLAYTYTATYGGRRWSADLVLGDTKTDLIRYALGKTGSPYGRSSGDIWRDKDM